MPAPPLYADVAPGVRLAVRERLYAVVGSTAEDLRAAMRVLGPARAGRSFGAFTDWTVAWRYHARAGAGGVRVGLVLVSVDVALTFPRWQRPRSAPARLVEAWEAYVAAVELHEQGHVRLAVKGGCAVRERLFGLPASSSAEELDRAAEEGAAEALRGVRAEELAYDRDTEHGRSQGVSLPGEPA